MRFIWEKEFDNYARGCFDTHWLMHTHRPKRGIQYSTTSITDKLVSINKLSLRPSICTSLHFGQQCQWPVSRNIWFVVFPTCYGFLSPIVSYGSRIQISKPGTWIPKDPKYLMNHSRWKEIVWVHPQSISTHPHPKYGYGYVHEAWSQTFEERECRFDIK